MSRHRFVNDGRAPIPMGATADYACVCGKRGTRAAIERHIAENWELTEDPIEHPAQPAASENYAAIVIKTDDDFGGDTKAHYLPVEPREPAFDADENTPTPPELPPPPPISPPDDDACPICRIGGQLADLPEITAWSCGHWIRKKPRPVAESFQDMLRAAFQAGVTAATSGEPFEIWYQREVLTP